MRYEIEVVSDADRVLYEGLPSLQPVLDRLGPSARLIGGLAGAAWLAERPVGVPIRATRDVDLGIDRVGVGITRARTVVGPLLAAHDFASGFGGEPFRFWRETERGAFVVDLLVARGASRETPPVVEEGIESLAAPGLRYALGRDAVPLELVLRAEETRSFNMYTIPLDAAFVMKAALVVSGVRTRPDQRVGDTADAVMLAAACAKDPEAVTQLREARDRGEAKTAIRWITARFGNARTAEAQRMGRYFGGDDGARWAVAVADELQRGLAG
jgi:hypothetical protein